MVVTDDKLNDTTVCRASDPVYKNIFWIQNPFEIAFNDISKFDLQNPIVGKS